LKAEADIAVVITSHNYGRYLGQCLQSVVDQSLCPKEVVVVDDASTDETASVMRQFPEVAYHPVSFYNGNRARNFGFSQVSSKAVVFFDADNYMTPDFLQVLYGALTRSEGVDFVYCDRIHFGEGDVSWYPHPMGLWQSRTFDRALLQTFNYIDLASLMWSRSFPGFDETLQRYQDWDLWLNMVLKNGRLGQYVAEPLFYYRVHGMNASRLQDRDRALWHIRRKYRIGFGALPGVRNLFWLYRSSRQIKAGLGRILGL
jgi:glycosyltransferase involved in cell wall biosynthesis